MFVLLLLLLSDSLEKCEFVLISVRPASRVSVCDKNFNVAIFLDTITMTNVKLCI